MIKKPKKVIVIETTTQVEHFQPNNHKISYNIYRIID
jgi:hypothetical protein